MCFFGHNANVAIFYIFFYFFFCDCFWWWFHTAHWVVCWPLLNAEWYLGVICMSARLTYYIGSTGIVDCLYQCNSIAWLSNMYFDLFSCRILIIGLDTRRLIVFCGHIWIMSWPHFGLVVNSYTDLRPSIITPIPVSSFLTAPWIIFL